MSRNSAAIYSLLGQIRVLVPISKTFTEVINHVSIRDVQYSRANLDKVLVVVPHAFNVFLLAILEIMMTCQTSPLTLEIINGLLGKCIPTVNEVYWELLELCQWNCIEDHRKICSFNIVVALGEFDGLRVALKPLPWFSFVIVFINVEGLELQRICNDSSRLEKQGKSSINSASLRGGFYMLVIQSVTKITTVELVT